jgi:branched-chain amino acid transport system substrate-binding protein
MLTVGLLATSCGGGGGSDDPIKIAFVTDCNSELSTSGPSLAGAELPFLQRGAKLRGPSPSSGVTEATVYGRRVQLLHDCESYGDFSTLLSALGRLVENEHADIVVGSNDTPEGLVIKTYARRYPWITFSTTSSEQSTTLKDPAPNLFRFVPDAAQDSAGLGAYAYRRLGWRNAVTVGEDDPAGWSEVAGFVAEFCSLGGNIVKHVWTGNFKNFGPVVAGVPARGVDGIVLPSDLQPFGRFQTALAKRHPRMAHRLLVNADPYSLEQSSLTRRTLGLVGVSPWPLASTPASRSFEAASARHFPGTHADFYSYDAMEPVLEALEQVHGDLSHREQRFQKALAQLQFRSPNGTITLDRRHQAIAPMYLGQVQKRHGKLVLRQIAVVPRVEQTFGGYFGPTTPPPGRKQPTCRRRKPPAWVSSVPPTR